MQDNKESKVVDFNPMTAEVEPTVHKFKPKAEGGDTEKVLSKTEQTEKHTKMVDPTIMANIRKNEREKARAYAVEEMVDTFMESFVFKWNDNPLNKDHQIEARLTPTSAPADNGMFQFCLALEVKKDGIWRVLCRVGQYSYPGDDRAMGILTTDLYRAMFVEIAHSGMLVAIAASDQREIHTHGKTQQSTEIVN